MNNEDKVNRGDVVEVSESSYGHDGYEGRYQVVSVCTVDPTEVALVRLHNGENPLPIEHLEVGYYDVWINKARISQGVS